MRTPFQPGSSIQLKEECEQLASRGIFIGTSSWKYPGWRGQIYDEARYCFRGKFSETRFNRNCLSEYAETFKTVCVDAAYYKFPDERQIEGLVSQVPDDFLFAFKVTDEITLKRFTRLPRFGGRAGRPNENFLNAGLFQQAFLQPCEPFKRRIGLLMFEFSRFHPGDFAHGREFMEALDQFLGKLPEGWPYGVEIRNQHFLRPDYFAMLRRHGAAHIFNSWQGMPPVSEQMRLPGSRTSDEFAAARFLLKPGRSYEEAVKAFEPYREVKEVNDEARKAGALLVRNAGQSARKAFIYVNNRLEGNAIETIRAMIALAGKGSLEA